jgi:hypothetical protein
MGFVYLDPAPFMRAAGAAEVVGACSGEYGSPRPRAGAPRPRTGSSPAIVPTLRNGITERIGGLGSRRRERFPTGLARTCSHATPSRQTPGAARPTRASPHPRQTRAPSMPPFANARMASGPRSTSTQAPAAARRPPYSRRPSRSAGVSMSIAEHRGAHSILWTPIRRSSWRAPMSPSISATASKYARPSTTGWPGVPS